MASGRRTAIVTGANRGLGLEMARQLAGHDVFVVMGGEAVPRSAAEGADTAVRVSLLASSGPSGPFFRNRKPIPS
jgi:NAD(P)-dependent dehydrogenase (short-subunit alcohol dehydrogenase family)